MGTDDRRINAPLQRGNRGKRLSILLAAIYVFITSVFFLEPVFGQSGLFAVEEARTAYLKAKQDEAAAKARVVPARLAEREAVKKLLNELTANQSVYDAVERDYSRLRAEIIAKYEDRARAAVVPASLLDEYTEYKRRYEILKDYRQFVDNASFRKLTDRIADMSRQLADVRATGERKVGEIDSEIAALQRRKTALDERLAAAISLPSNVRLFASWAVALSALGKAEQDSIVMEAQAAKAFNTYTELMLKTSPPFLKSVVVTAAGEKIYIAEWVRKQPAIARGMTQNEIDLEAAALRGANAQLDKDIELIQSYLNERAAERLQIALGLQFLGSRMESAASEILPHKEAQIIGTGMIEALAAIVEVAVTGGASTLAREGPKLAESAAGKFFKTAAWEARREAGSGLARAEMQVVKSIFDKEEQRLLLRTTQEWAFAQGVLPAVRVQLSPQRVKLLSIKAARERAAEQAEAALWRNKVPEFFGTYGGAGFEGEKMVGGVVAPAVKYGVNYPGEDIRNFENFLNPDQWKSVVLSDTLELGFARSATGIGLQGLETLDWIKAKRAIKIVGMPASRWQKLQASFAFKNFKQAFKPDPGLLITAVSTGLKAALTKYLSVQELKAIERWTAASNRFTNEYAVYRTSLEADQKVWLLQQNYRRQKVQNLGRLSQLRLPRELKITRNEMIGRPSGHTYIEFGFSTYLSAPPVATLGGKPLLVRPLGPAETTDRWTATIPIDDLPRDLTDLPLTLGLTPGGKFFANLDSRPSTSAYVDDVVAKHWSDYEPGDDTIHKIKALNLSGEWMANGYEEGSEKIVIRHEGTAIAATKATGSIFVPIGQITWKGTFDRNPFSGTVQIAKSKNRDAKWIKATATVQNKDTITVQDENGWVSQLVRLKC